MARIPPVLAFAICSFIWGTTWLAIKIGYEGLDAVWGASIRFLMAGTIAAILLVATNTRLPTSRRQVAVIGFVGLVLFGLDYGLIYWGEQYIPSGLTAILFATMPLFIALMTQVAIPHEGASARHLGGVVIGLLGLGVIFYQELRLGGSGLGPPVAIVASAICAASASVVARRWGHDIAPLAMNTGAMIVGGIALLAASLALHEAPALPTTGRAWASLLYLVLLGSIVSFILYWDLLKRWGANKAGMVPIVTPVVAVVTGLLVGERLTALQWIGSAIVLGGVALSLVPWKAPAPITPAAPTEP